MKHRKTSGMAIGLDTTDDATVRIAGLSHGTVVFESTDPKSSPELAGRLTDGSSATASLPPSQAILLKLKTPAIPADKLRKILPSLLDIQLPFPISECSCVFMEGAGTYTAHAVRNSDLESCVAALSEKGFNPARIVPPAVAAWEQALEEFPPESPTEPRAVFIAGDSQTLLVHGIGKALGGQSVFGNARTEAPRRLRLAMGGLPEGLRCVCAGTGHETVLEAVAATAPAGSKVFSADSPAFFLARALAFDSVRNGGKTSDSNLRTGALAHRASVRRDGAPVKRLCTVLAVCAIAVAAASFYAMNRARSAAAESSRMLSKIIDEVAGYRVAARGEHGVAEARAAVAERRDPAVVAYAKDALANMLPSLAPICKRNSIALHHISMTANGITASGSAATVESIDAFVEELNSSGIQANRTEAPQKQEDGSFRFFVHPARQP